MYYFFLMLLILTAINQEEHSKRQYYKCMLQNELFVEGIGKTTKAYILQNEKNTPRKKKNQSKDTNIVYPKHHSRNYLTV